MGEASLAKLLADLDQFGGQGLVAPVAGNLLAGLVDLLGAEGASTGPPFLQYMYWRNPEYEPHTQ